MKCFAMLLLSLLIPLAHAELMPLTIGDTTIQFPVDAGYIRISQADPKVFELTQAALPPTNRLVEAFETSSDIERTKSGSRQQDIYYVVQVVREIESRQIGIDEWNENKPQLTAGMSKLDLNKEIASKMGDMNARISNAAGQSVGVGFGKISSPAIYRETPLSIEFTMIVPYQASTGSNSISGTMAAAGGMVLVRNKIISINAYSDSTTDAGLADLRKHLDAMVDQTLSLNPSDPDVSTSPGLFNGVGRSAAIGAAIGVLVGFFAWLIGRLRKSPKA